MSALRRPHAASEHRQPRAFNYERDYGDYGADDARNCGEHVQPVGVHVTHFDGQGMRHANYFDR